MEKRAEGVSEAFDSQEVGNPEEAPKMSQRVRETRVGSVGGAGERLREEGLGEEKQGALTMDVERSGQGHIESNPGRLEAKGAGKGPCHRPLSLRPHAHGGLGLPCALQN